MKNWQSNKLKELEDGTGSRRPLLGAVRVLIPNSGTNEVMDMEDIVFKTSLSMEEIEKRFTGMDYFTILMGSLEEALLLSRLENGKQKELDYSYEK